MVDEDAIATVGHVERNVLVGYLAAGAAVVVPEVDDLAVLDKGCEALAKAVDALADAQIELIVDEASLRGIDDGDGAPAAAGDDPVAIQEIDAPVAFLSDAGRQVAAGELAAFTSSPIATGPAERVQLELPVCVGGGPCGGTIWTRITFGRGDVRRTVSKGTG